jgi:hypothetical protein
MKTRPRDLDASTIAGVLEDGWGIERADLRYAPVGFGSHHWIATTPHGDRWFLTVDDLHSSHLSGRERDAFATLDTAFRTAAALRNRAELSFVIAPIPGSTGQILRRLCDRYALSVFPFLEVEPASFGEFRSSVDRDAVMRLIGQVHNASGLVFTETLRRNTLLIQGRERFLEAMRSLEDPWTGGPFAEPARQLLRSHAGQIRTVLARFDALAAAVNPDASDWAVTHGEPHAANVIRTRAGAMVIVDWDTVAFGPRERDLWMLVDDAKNDWAAYRDVTGVTAISDETIATYRLHWALSEIAVYTAWFRDAHDRTEDIDAAWVEFQQYVKGLR